MLICSGVQTDSTLQSYLCFHIMQAYKISLICLCLGQGFLWAWGRLDDIEQYLFHQMHFSPSSVSGTLHPIFLSLPPPPRYYPQNISLMEASGLLLILYTYLLELQISKSASMNVRGPEAPSRNSAFLLVPV